MSDNRLHVVFGSGGSKAILGGAGALLAFEIGGAHEWASVGSCSGGTLPAVYMASRKPTGEFLRMVVDLDFRTLLKAKTGFLWRLLAILFKYKNEIVRPERGVYSAAPMAKFVGDLIGDWPENFWLVSSGRKGTYIISRDTIRFEDRVLPRELTLGQAINASCAVPGFIDGVRFRGDILHDGALSPFGECPAAVPVLHFGAVPSQVVAFDIEPEPIKNSGWLRLAWKTACMGQCAPFEAIHVDPRQGYVLIRPNITGFHGLQFDLSRDLKWQAICTGFTAAAETLLHHKIVRDADKRESLLRLCARLCAIRSEKSAVPFSTRVEAMLSGTGLLPPRRNKK